MLFSVHSMDVHKIMYAEIYMLQLFFFGITD